jgi:hypothetical protein
MLSDAQDEPRWMLEKRYQGWYHYNDLNPPLWRRTDIGRLDWEKLIPHAPPQAPVADLDALPTKLQEALSI